MIEYLSDNDRPPVRSKHHRARLTGQVYQVTDLPVNKLSLDFQSF